MFKGVFELTNMVNIDDQSGKAATVRLEPRYDDSVPSGRRFDKTVINMRIDDPDVIPILQEKGRYRVTIERIDDTKVPQPQAEEELKEQDSLPPVEPPNPGSVPDGPPPVKPGEEPRKVPAPESDQPMLGVDKKKMIDVKDAPPKEEPKRGHPQRRH